VTLASVCRASPIFQLSKLCTELLNAARTMLGAGDIDPLVLGAATGVLVVAECIKPGMQLAGGEPCVLLVQSATGDEEVRGIATRPDSCTAVCVAVRANIVGPEISGAGHVSSR
jgi:hypothetical protein